MKAFVSRNPVAVLITSTLFIQFLVVLVVWAILPEGAHIHDDETAHSIFRLRGFGPLIMAVGITAYIEGRAGLRHLFAAYFKWRVPAKWYLLAFSWKFMFTYVGMTFVVLLGLKHWPGFIVEDFFNIVDGPLYQLIMNMPFIVGIALVEETAWMKFSVTRLQDRFNAFTSCAIVGVCWGLWYLPMLLLGDGVPDGYPWPLFMLSMFALTILLGWTYNMTRSGTILLIMQIVSNCAFFVMPVLPGWHALNPTYVNSFVIVNFAVAMFLVWRYGPKNLGVGVRATWSGRPPADAEEAPAVKPLPAV
jgi:membrane protease YdiL (CAAX protease family)